MVALGVVAVITLFVIGVLTRIIGSGGKSAHQTAAQLLAQEALGAAIKAGPPNWGFSSASPSTWIDHRSLHLPNEEASTRFDFKVEALNLRRSNEDLGAVYQVTTTVWWWSDEPTAKVEQGQTSVTTTRTVYVRSDTGTGP